MGKRVLPFVLVGGQHRASHGCFRGAACRHSVLVFCSLGYDIFHRLQLIDD